MQAESRGIGGKRKGFSQKVAEESLRRFNIDFGANLELRDFTEMAAWVVRRGHAPSADSSSSRFPAGSLEHAVLVAFGEALCELGPEQIGRLKSKAADALAVVRTDLRAARTRCRRKIADALWGERNAAVSWGPMLRGLAAKWADAWLVGLDDAEAVIDREIEYWSVRTGVEDVARKVGNIGSPRGFFAVRLIEAFRNYPSVKPRQATRAIALLWLATGWYVLRDKDFNPRFSTETAGVVREVQAALRANRSG